MGGVTAIRNAVLSTNMGYGAYMAVKWGTTGRDLPRAPWMNSVLQGRAQIEAATEEVKRLRLPPCPDISKNWDTLAAVREVLQRTSKEARVLDAGAEMYSRFLPWLYLYGYRNLCGNNLVFRDTGGAAPSSTSPAMSPQCALPRTRSTRSCCLSVVEHGVDLERISSEMSRGCSNRAVCS